MHAYGYDNANNVAFLGCTVVTVQASSDTVGPTADSVTNSGSPTSNTSFSVFANNVTDSGSGVNTVTFPVWTESNGQDDIYWYTGSFDAANNRWQVTINTADHNNESGDYNVHVYGYDNSDNVAFLGFTIVTVQDGSFNAVLPVEKGQLLPVQEKQLTTTQESTET